MADADEGGFVEVAGLHPGDGVVDEQYPVVAFVGSVEAGAGAVGVIASGADDCVDAFSVEVLIEGRAVKGVPSWFPSRPFPSR